MGSNTRRKQRSEALVAAVRDAVTISLLPALCVGVAEQLGEVRLELRGRNDDWSTELRSVTACVAEELPQVTPAAVPVRVPAVQCSFWEKATILGARRIVASSARVQSSW